MTVKVPRTFLGLSLLLFVFNFMKLSVSTELSAFFAAAAVHVLFGVIVLLPVLIFSLNYMRCFFMKMKLHVLSLVITRDKNGRS